jgi:hypothetical protein
MPEDLFLQLLLKNSVARLREMRAQADEMVRVGERDREYIDKALAMKGTETSQPVRATSNPPVRRSSPKPGAAREPIIQIAQSNAEHVWLPSEMRNLLQDRFGIDLATGTVRAAMKRLLDEKVLARPTGSPNGFKLASTNGSHGEPNAEAANSATGGYGRQDALAPADGSGS